VHLALNRYFCVANRTENAQEQSNQLASCNDKNPRGKQNQFNDKQEIHGRKSHYPPHVRKLKAERRVPGMRRESSAKRVLCRAIQLNGAFSARSVDVLDELRSGYYATILGEQKKRLFFVPVEPAALLKLYSHLHH
tara:strand:+ start:48 stop:455 length:408 start_codon:yes stop_codon:yes gene_type:complete